MQQGDVATGATCSALLAKVARPGCTCCGDEWPRHALEAASLGPLLGGVARLDAGFNGAPDAAVAGGEAAPSLRGVITMRTRPPGLAGSARSSRSFLRTWCMRVRDMYVCA